MSELGPLIRVTREKKNMSLADLSRAIEDRSGRKISRAQLCLLESGRRVPTLELAYEVSKGLEIDLQIVTSAAFRDRLEHAYRREIAALDEFAKGRRLRKQLDVNSITDELQMPSLGNV